MISRNIDETIIGACRAVLESYKEFLFIGMRDTSRIYLQDFHPTHEHMVMDGVDESFGIRNEQALSPGFDSSLALAMCLVAATIFNGKWWDFGVVGYG